MKWMPLPSLGPFRSHSSRDSVCVCVRVEAVFQAGPLAPEMGRGGSTLPCTGTGALRRFLTAASFSCPPLSSQLNSPLNPVSSTEDIKPPLGINGVLKVPMHPSSAMPAFTKHICAICGDRSSGNANLALFLAGITALSRSLLLVGLQLPAWQGGHFPQVGVTNRALLPPSQKAPSTQQVGSPCLAGLGDAKLSS